MVEEMVVREKQIKSVMVHPLSPVPAKLYSVRLEMMQWLMPRRQRNTVTKHMIPSRLLIGKSNEERSAAPEITDGEEGGHVVDPDPLQSTAPALGRTRRWQHHLKAD
ncbi:MAG: hypothetical protein Q9182_002825 [Xanthomendoza sp. 2 TL-2023]